MGPRAEGSLPLSRPAPSSELYLAQNMTFYLNVMMSGSFGK